MAGRNGGVERAVPRGCKDWHQDLIIAAQCRHTHATIHNHRIKEVWGDAVRFLQESRHPIYIQPSGQSAGRVKGLP